MYTHTRTHSHTHTHTHTHTHQNKMGVCITGNHNRKGRRGNMLSWPRERSSVSPTVDRHLINICPRSICKWQRIITVTRSSDRSSAVMTNRQCQKKRAERIQSILSFWTQWESVYNHSNSIALLQLSHSLLIIALCYQLAVYPSAESVVALVL